MLRKWVITAVVAALATSLPARAQETPSTAIAPRDAFAIARARIVSGKLAEARAELDAATKSGDDPASRAVAFELVFVVDTWIAGGGLPKARGESPGGGGDWEAQLVDGRGRLVRGEYAGAARRLGPLAAAAPHPLRGAVAAELARLASDLANERPQPASVPPVAPVVSAPPVASTARAAEPESPAPSGTTESRWYGWQPLLLDAGAIAIVALGSKSNAAVVFGVGVYSLGGPIVHIVHGRFGTSGLDLAVRLLAPTLFSLIGFASCSNVDTRECITPVAVGAAIGVGAAVVLDAALLSHEDVPREKTSGLTITPSLGGVRGSF